MIYVGKRHGGLSRWLRWDDPQDARMGAPDQGQVIPSEQAFLFSLMNAHDRYVVTFSTQLTAPARLTLWRDVAMLPDEG